MTDTEVANPYAPRYEKSKRRGRKGPNPYRGKQSTIYRRKAAALKASEEGGVCAICHGPIDRNMPSDQSQDPGYWTVDHDPPLDQGGSLLEGMRPAHKGCNSSEGGKVGRAKQRHPGVESSEIERSRDW